MDIDNTCDVKFCGKPAIGHFIVGQEALLWMCEEHELPTPQEDITNGKRGK